MACCSPLGEATASVAVVDNIDEMVIVAEVERVLGEIPATPDGERCLASPDTEDPLSEGGSNNENPQTYYFGSNHHCR
jgi:hypothetical protein